MTELRVAQDRLCREGTFSGGRFPPSGCAPGPRVPVSSSFARSLELLARTSGLHVRVSAVFAGAILVCSSWGRPGQRTIIKGLRVPCAVTATPHSIPGGQQQRRPCGVGEAVTQFIFLRGGGTAELSGEHLWPFHRAPGSVPRGHGRVSAQLWAVPCGVGERGSRGHGWLWASLSGLPRVRAQRPHPQPPWKSLVTDRESDRS